MKKIYICSRYRAKTKKELKFNKAIACYYCKQVLSDGNIPIAPHLYFPQFLDDSNAIERGIGIEIGIEILKECEEYLVISIDGKLSEGMQTEIDTMRKNHMKGLTIAITREYAKELLKKTKVVR